MMGQTTLLFPLVLLICVLANTKGSKEESGKTWCRSQKEVKKGHSVRLKFKLSLDPSKEQTVLYIIHEGPSNKTPHFVLEGEWNRTEERLDIKQFDDERYVLSINGLIVTLVILEANDKDEGIYFCEDSRGKTSENYSLTVTSFEREIPAECSANTWIIIPWTLISIIIITIIVSCAYKRFQQTNGDRQETVVTETPGNERAPLMNTNPGHAEGSVTVSIPEDEADYSTRSTPNQPITERERGSCRDVGRHQQPAEVVSLENVYKKRKPY